jgi:hypothetical protein
MIALCFAKRNQALHLLLRENWLKRMYFITIFLLTWQNECKIFDQNGASLSLCNHFQPHCPLVHSYRLATHAQAIKRLNSYSCLPMIDNDHPFAKYRTSEEVRDDHNVGQIILDNCASCCIQVKIHHFERPSTNDYSTFGLSYIF